MGGSEMKTFNFFADVIIQAENEEDARIELTNLMDEHEIYWELKEKPDNE